MRHIGMLSFPWLRALEHRNYGVSPLQKIYKRLAITDEMRRLILQSFPGHAMTISPNLHGIPLETLIAVGTHAMPLDVFADWLEDRGHPWFSIVRTIAERGEAHHEVRFGLTDKDFDPHQRTNEIKAAYPFTRLVGWEAVERDRVYYLTIFATRAMLLDYITTMVCMAHNGPWYRSTVNHIPILLPNATFNDHLP